MIVAGAGGHALEIIDILQLQGIDRFLVYGENINSPSLLSRFTCVNSWESVENELLQNPSFSLAVGNPFHRANLYREFIGRGGRLHSLRGLHSWISPQTQADHADILHHCYVGAEVKLGKGALINTGAQIHHESIIGDFSVINPGAILLGASQIGDFCSIGSHATVLPGVKIGNKVTVGAGAVIIRDVPDGVTVVGVPGKVVSKQ